jgi:ribonucleoside-diphosphate reductase beta chain
MMMVHTEFLTTSPRGLNREHPALKMFQKAKKLGVWDPAAIDLTQDRADWETSPTKQKDATLRLISLFQAGEESVTLDLLPPNSGIAREGHLEEEMFLTSFLFEEAKHVEFMNRFLTEGSGRAWGRPLALPFALVPQNLLRGAAASDAPPHL